MRLCVNGMKHVNNFKILLKLHFTKKEKQNITLLLSFLFHHNTRTMQFRGLQNNRKSSRECTIVLYFIAYAYVIISILDA